MASILKEMSSTSSDNDGHKTPKGQGSPSVEAADKGRNPKMRKGRGSSSVEGADKGGEISLKKGAWTQAEDAILIEYVKNNGEGNWNAVQKYSGLARCGKSCRLRWTNHLRPDLKKGAFTKEEKQKIFQLHASMGNKWALMAAMLPGRTDNEIKNFWNSRVKRMQRAGQTTYPEDVEIYQQEVPNGNQETLNPDTALTNEAGQHDSILQTESYDIPDVEFKRLKLPPYIYDPSISMPMTVSDMLPQQHNMFPMMHPSKRLRGNDTIYNSLDPSAISAFDQYDTSDPTLLCPCDAILNTSDQFGNYLTGSHAYLNGNISASSDPIDGAFKVELPSLQYFEAQKHIWHTPESSLPPLESVDTPESSIQFQPNRSATFSHQNSDSLLESVIYGLNGSINVDSFQENNDDCVLNEEVQSSTLNPSETQWDEQETLRSSLGPFAASVQWDEPEALRSLLGLFAASVQFDEPEALRSSLGPFSASVQWDEPEALRSSVGPFAASVAAEYTNITNCIYSMETIEDDGDKHGALTEFPADSPENQNPIEFLLDPDPAPDLSFMESYYINGES